MFNWIKRVFASFSRDLTDWEDDFEKDIGMDASPSPVAQTPSQVTTSSTPADVGTQSTAQK